MVSFSVKHGAIAALSGMLLGIMLWSARGYVVIKKVTPTAKGASGKMLANVAPCTQLHIPLYGVVQMTDQRSAVGPSSGLAVAAVRMLAPGVNPTILTSATKSDGVTPVSEDALSALPGVERSGMAFAQSEDPALRSCDYKLADRPADQPLIQAAKAALGSNGLATAEQMNSDGAVYLVSDDPLDANDEIVTIDVPTTSTELPNGGHSFASEHLVAVVDKSTDAVSEIGQVPAT